MKICEFCSKKSIVVGSYSNRVRATQYNPTGKKRKQVNLQWAFLPSGERKKLCSACRKTLTKVSK